MNAYLRLFAGKPRGKAGGKRGKQAPCGENLLNLRKLPQKEAGTRDEKTKENAVPHHRCSGAGAGAQAAAASAHVGGAQHPLHGHGPHRRVMPPKTLQALPHPAAERGYRKKGWYLL